MSLSDCKWVLESCTQVVRVVLLVLVTLVPRASVALPPPLTLTYDLYSAGYPVLILEFQLNETEDSYRVAGLIRSTGIADFFMRYVLRTESEGTNGAEGLRPNLYMSDSHSRVRQRSARLQFRADGSILTSLAPPEDPSNTSPTEQQIRGSFDPLAGILQAGHIVARLGHCVARIPIFDGRRRYDLVFSDEGIEHILRSDDYAYAGDARRCRIDMIKIAGFSTDPDSYGEKADRALVWLATPHPDAPPLPVRLEFTGALGPTKVWLVAVRGGR
jgi:hypothetical protein